MPAHASKDAPRTGFARGLVFGAKAREIEAAADAEVWENGDCFRVVWDGVRFVPVRVEPEDVITEQDRIDIDRSQFEATVQEAVLKFGAVAVRKWIRDYVREKGATK